jgi:hypothetical protein
MIRIFCFTLLASLTLPVCAQTAADALRVEMVFWESIRSSTDPADFRAYLEQYPQGRFAPLARNRLAALGHPVPAAPVAPVAPAAPAAAVKPEPAKPAASGALAPGNTWTYRVLGRGSVQRGTQQVTLAAATNESMVEEILADGVNSRVEHRKGYYLVPAGNVTLFSPYLAAFGELRQGPINIDVLDPRTCNAGWTCQVRGRVMGRERVRVPAGTFEATRVEISQYWQTPAISYASGETVSRTLTVWYAPEVKRAIKFTGRGGPARAVDTEFEIELVGYQLK